MIYTKGKNVSVASVIKDLVRPLVNRFPLLKKTYHNFRDDYLFYKEPAMTPLGFKFSGNPLMESGTFEIDEVTEFKKHIQDIDVVVNVGANIGFYCCIALQADKRVVAFEPFQRNLRHLYKNVVANKLDDIEVFPVALSNTTGIIEIFGFGTGASLIDGWAGFSKNYSSLVPCSTLDTCLGNRLEGKNTFFLVDIEGAEKMMLEGATKHLKMQPRPVWMVEISVSELQPDGQINPHLLDTFDLFWENGYEAHTIGQNSRTISREEITSIISRGEGTLDGNNFIFK